jgi:hypothetical protein
MLDLRLESRYTIYDSSEKTGEFVVDAGLSYTNGQPFINATPTAATPFDTLEFDIRVEENDELLVENSVAVNTTANVFGFDLSVLEPRLTPYNVVLYGAPPSSYFNQSYEATAELFYLPAKNNGSTVKLDNLNGGLLVANNVTGYAFEPLLSFGFYTSCGGMRAHIFPRSAGNAHLFL